MTQDASGAMLGYLDELGRMATYHADGQLQLSGNYNEGVWFNTEGVVKRRWSSTNSGSFQPITVSLNKHVTVKCLGRVSEQTKAVSHSIIIPGSFNDSVLY